MSAAAPPSAVPTLSAAEALAAAPFFAELNPVDLARLVPELEEHQYAPGESVFCKGEPGDGLYLIRSGEAKVRVPAEDGGYLIDTLGPTETFGEMALLSDRPRSADVLAETPLSVWKLPRESFEALLHDRAHIATSIAAALAERLAETTRRLTATQRQIAMAARAAYGALDPAAQALLRRASVLEELDRDLLRDLLGAAWSDEAFERIMGEAVFFRPTERDGGLAFADEAVQGFLLGQLRAELGERGVADWQRRAAEALLARGDVDPRRVLGLVAASGDWSRLRGLLEDRADELVRSAPERVEGYLRSAPEKVLWRSPRLVGLLAACCSAQGKLEQAIEAYREAERRDPAAREGSLALAYQRALADLCERAGRAEEALACRNRLSELESAGAVDDGTVGLQTDVPVAAEERARDGAGEKEPSSFSSPFALQPRWIAAIAVLALTSLAWFVPPPAGLTPPQLRVLATVSSLVALSFLDVLPDYLLGLLMVGAWVVTGTLPPEVAAAGFASSTWFLMLGAMAVGAAIERSGLLYRGAIELVRRLPPSYAARSLILAALGVFFSMGMPSGPARILLAAPLTQDISESLRYEDRSNGSAGLALATYVGFGLMGNLFLTGNPLALLLYGLFPPDVQSRMSWVNWLLAALPTHVILFALLMGFVLLKYRPKGESGVPAGTLALQQRVLGPLKRSEKVVLLTIALLLAGFATQGIHHVDPAWIAVAAVGLLFLAGALDDAGLRHGVNLSFLLYMGVILGFGRIFSQVELDKWLSQNLGGLANLTGGNQLLFVLGVAAIATICGLLFRPGPIGLLIWLALQQTAVGIGVDPWVVAMAILLPMMFWVYPQQNAMYLTAYYGSGEQAFSHAQARPLALFHVLASFIALALSVPIWKLMGLIG